MGPVDQNHFNEVRQVAAPVGFQTSFGRVHQNALTPVAKSAIYDCLVIDQTHATSLPVT